MSVQASLQKASDWMIREKIQCMNGLVMVETYCGMHVGVKLRAAEVKGISKYVHSSEQQHFSVGISHCACSMQATWPPGVIPVYWRGVLGFPEFLRSALEEARAAVSSTEHIREVMKVKIEK